MLVKDRRLTENQVAHLSESEFALFLRDRGKSAKSGSRPGARGTAEKLNRRRHSKNVLRKYRKAWTRLNQGKPRPLPAPDPVVESVVAVQETGSFIVVPPQNAFSSSVGALELPGGQAGTGLAGFVRRSLGEQAGSVLIRATGRFHHNLTVLRSEEVRGAAVVPRRNCRTVVELLDRIGMMIIHNPTAAQRDAFQAVGAAIMKDEPVSCPPTGVASGDSAPVLQGSAEWHLKAINAAAASAKDYSGEGGVIGLLDSYVDPTHPEIKAKLAAYRVFNEKETRSVNKRSRKRNQRVIVDQGVIDLLQTDREKFIHGTHVAALVAGSSVGVARKAKLAVAVVLTRMDGGQSSGLISQVLRGFNWLSEVQFDQKVFVINASLASNDFHDELYRAINTQWQANRRLVVAAIGNTAGGTACPGNLDCVIGVGATDRNGQVSNYSGRGLGGQQNNISKPDLVAPGSGIVSARAGGGYTELDGTSMASPMVAAAVAMVIAKHKTMADDLARARAAVLAAVAPVAPVHPGDIGAGRGGLDLSKLP